MPATKHRPPVQILNSVCPVCGGPIMPTGMLVELPTGRRGESLLVVHVCSDDCAEATRADAERYSAAARDNRRG